MVKEFQIETIKWSWPETVKSPSIYRDDEFIKTSSKEESLDAIEYLMAKSSMARNLAYTITVLREGEYFTYWRRDMPCLGGLVKYKDTHGDKYSMNPYFPRDIRVSFPEGDIVYIACQFKMNKSSELFNFLLSTESPWVSAFGSPSSIILNNSYLVLTDMNTDPTVFYSLMRLGKLGKSDFESSTSKWNPKAQLLADLGPSNDPRRLAGQCPIRISGGTWAEGYGYTRPYNEAIFKESIPLSSLEEFANIKGSYPQVNIPSCFKAEMLKQFKFNTVDIFKPESEKILVEAWEYFKQQASTLGSGFKSPV